MPYNSTYSNINHMHLKNVKRKRFSYFKDNILPQTIQYKHLPLTLPIGIKITHIILAL